MWKDVDALHPGHDANATHGSYVRHDAAGQGEAIEPGETNGVASECDTGVLHHALREIRELFIRIPPVDPRQRSPQAMPSTPGLDDTVTHTNPGEQRVIFVGNWCGVVRQRHYLSLVFELPHVEEVRHVLEEHAQRAPGGRRGQDRKS